MTTDASITVVNIASTFGQRELYNPCVGSDYYNTHRSTGDDPLPGGHFLYHEGSIEGLIKSSSRSSSRLAERDLLLDSIKELAVPDNAVVGDNHFRKSVDTKVGVWRSDGGWIVFSASIEDETPHAKHNQMIERTEGTAEPMQWVSSCKSLVWWNKLGENSSFRVRMTAEVMNSLNELNESIPGILGPKRHSCAYRLQADLLQVWVPL